MTASYAVQIADQMAAQINAVTFGVPIVARRAYVVALNLRELKTIQVSIVPKSVETTRFSRGEKLATIEIDLAIQRTVQDTEEADALMILTDQVIDLFEFRDLDNDVATHIKTDRKFIYDSEGMETKKLFTSLTMLTYQLHP